MAGAVPDRRIHWDDIEFMIGLGESPEKIADRLETRPGSVDTAIRRDIKRGLVALEDVERALEVARAFGRAHSRRIEENNDRTCACGTALASGNKSGSCHRCSMQRLWLDPEYRRKQGIGSARAAEHRPRLGNGQFAG
jgi:hypothetical protein